MLTEATIFRGAFWFSIGAIFERAIFFLLPIFIAPLGPANLGIFHLSLRIFHGIVSIPNNALNIQFIRKLRLYLQDPKDRQFAEEAAFLLKVYFICGAFLGIMLFIVILLFAPLKSPAILAFALPFALISSYLLVLMRLLQRFDKIFLIQILAFGLQFFYLVIFIKILKMGIAAAFLGQLLFFMLTSILSVIFLFDRLNLLGLFKKIASSLFALPILSMAHILFITLFPMLDLALVTVLFGFSTLGHYIILLYLPLIIHMIPTTLFGMFVHVASIKTHALENITKISGHTFKWILIITIPPFVVIMLYPEGLLSMLFHKSYLKDLEITRLLAAAFFIQSVSWMASRILIVKNQKLINVWSNYLLGGLFVTVAIFLSPSLGLYGIALAYLIYSVLDALVKYIICVLHGNVSFIGMDHLKIYATGVISFILANMIFSGKVYLFLPFFLSIYLATLWVIGILNWQILYQLRKIILKRPATEEVEYDQ